MYLPVLLLFCSFVATSTDVQCNSYRQFESLCWLALLRTTLQLIGSVHCRLSAPIHTGYLQIQTLDQSTPCSPGLWLIAKVLGAHYSCLQVLLYAIKGQPHVQAHACTRNHVTIIDKNRTRRRLVCLFLCATFGLLPLSCSPLRFLSLSCSFSDQKMASFVFTSADQWM